MIELARECADGMLSYLVTPAHTAMARERPRAAIRCSAPSRRSCSRRPGRGAPHRARAHELVLRPRQLPAEPARAGLHRRGSRGRGERPRSSTRLMRVGRCRRDRRARARAPRRRRGPRLHPAAADRRRSLRARSPAQARARAAVRAYFLRGERLTKSSAISSNVHQRTPSCLLMCSMIRSCISSTPGRPETSGCTVIVKTA